MPTYNEEKYKLKNLWNSQQFYDIAYDLLKNKSLTEAKKTIGTYNKKRIASNITLSGEEISDVEIPFIIKYKFILMTNWNYPTVPANPLPGQGVMLKHISNKYRFSYRVGSTCIFNPR